MKRRWQFLTICLAAGLAPLLHQGPTRPSAAATGFPGWPAQFDHRPISPLPMNEREIAFYASFPGQVGRFTDGQREFILRWVHTGSRKLHSSADCFRGLGYEVHPQPAARDRDGQAWSGFQAFLGPHRLRVYEQIRDARGVTWTDVSAWYWSSILGQSQGPWLAVTRIERE